jgi:hypothetical protein
LRMQKNGKVALIDQDKGLMFATRSKDPDGPHYAVFEKGQLVVYRGTPERHEVALWKSKAVSEPGTYKLGINVSKRLVIFREVNGTKREIVWMSR